MADLTNTEKRQFERLLGMGSGYVLDFSNRTFAEFVIDSTGRDPYDAKYDHGSSKANRLRGFWAAESNRMVGKLMADLAAYAKGLPGGEKDAASVEQCERTIARLLQDNPVQELDTLVALGNKRDFEIIAKAVRDAIDRDELDQRHLGHLDEQPASEVLCPDRCGPPATGAGVDPLGADGRSGRPGHAASGCQRGNAMKRPSWLRRFVPYLGRRQAEEDLREELRLHLELECERQRDAGVPASDALRAARRALGNATLIRERTRDVWGWRWLDDFARDVRHGVRGLRRSPGFTATAVIVVGLGTGANTAMFSIVYGMLIRPLPYPDADAIVRVGHVSSARPDGLPVLSNITFPRLQQRLESFEQIAGYAPRPMAWLGPDGPRSLQGAMVSPALFPLLRAAPHLGRLLVEVDAREGADPVVLLSHSAWTNRYASDPGMVGALLDLDGEAFTVIGVLSEGFSFPSPEEELWTPLVVPAFEPVGSAIGLVFSALGRLRPGVSPELAATEVRTVLNADRSPSDPRPRLEARVVPLQEEMVRAFRPALLVLSAVTMLVLAIACVNVAGLFLAHGIARQRELAVRGALGAGRSRIVRQLLTESVALGVSGGALGLAAAALVLRVAPALAPGDVPRLDEIGVDSMTLAISAGLSVAAGLMFGTVPALSWSRLDFVRGLNEGSVRVAGGYRILSANRNRAALAVAQVALALVLLVGAGLLLRSFMQLVSVDPGYDAGNVLTARVNHPELNNLILSGQFKDA